VGGRPSHRPGSTGVQPPAPAGDRRSSIASGQFEERGADSPRVLVVDDHRIVREWLRFHLTRSGYEVVEASTGRDAIARARATAPQAVVLDMGLPDIPGTEVCAAILREMPNVAVVVLTQDADQTTIASVFDSGARGYLLKDADEIDVPGAIGRALRNESVIDPRAAAILARSFTTRASAPDVPRLTAHEVQILRLAAKGLTNNEIGRELHLSRHTVKEYLSNAMRKLDVKSRIEAVLEATRRGILPPDPPADAGGGRGGGTSRASFRPR
jgi:two-component system response regulator DevR